MAMNRREFFKTTLVAGATLAVGGCGEPPNGSNEPDGASNGHSRGV